MLNILALLYRWVRQATSPALSLSACKNGAFGKPRVDHAIKTTTVRRQSCASLPIQLEPARVAEGTAGTTRARETQESMASGFCAGTADRQAEHSLHVTLSRVMEISKALPLNRRDVGWNWVFHGRARVSMGLPFMHGACSLLHPTMSLEAWCREGGTATPGGGVAEGLQSFASNGNLRKLFGMLMR